MSKDLIERLDEAAQRLEYDGKFNPNMAALGQLLREAIAALSPPLPGEIATVAGVLRKHAFHVEADLIKRLARDSAMWEKAAHYWKDNHADQQQRNVELETNLKKSDMAAMDYQARIAELESNWSESMGHEYKALSDENDALLDAGLLRKENKRLDAALVEILDDIEKWCPDEMPAYVVSIRRRARKARAGG